MSIPKMTPQEAQRVLHALGMGEPPSPHLVTYLSIGLEPDIRVFKREFFSPDSFVVSRETEGSTFKIVEAYYGGGKTHYLRAIERVAHEHGFASAFVALKKDECPLTRFDLIYTAVADALTVALPSGQRIRGIGNVLRAWVDTVAQEEEQRLHLVQGKVDAIRDLPLMSIKIALRVAVLAYASGDHAMFDEALTYLTSGKISSALKKHGVLDKIDKTNGSLALRSLVGWLRDAGYAGFVFILDEGDRSLSIVSSNDKISASNNLVQLINETASEQAWPGTVLLYSIPSWDEFEKAFGRNEALLQRAKPTGFPMVPPATRIPLNERYKSDQQRKQFCLDLAERLTALYQAAYPRNAMPSDRAARAADIVAEVVVDRDLTASFRRTFIQSFIAALYNIEDGDLSRSDAEMIYSGQASQIARQG
jgi:hypothetical protein